MFTEEPYLRALKNLIGHLLREDVLEVGPLLITSDRAVPFLFVLSSFKSDRFSYGF